MAILPIKTFPDAILRKKAKRVTSTGKSIAALANDMYETMESYGGVGLAAPQIGVSLRLIVIEEPEKQEKIVLINPEIVRRKGQRTVDEGCLSFPGYRGEIVRSVSVVVKGMDLKGKEVRIKACELLAEVLEHELDHLNGVLFIDHLESRDKLYKVEKAPESSEDKVPVNLS